jgi:hypothetical protein
MGVSEEFDYNVDDKLKVYPNPASDVLNVTITTPNEELNKISIYNYTGQLVHEFDINVSTGSWNFKIDLSEYSKGLYTMEYTNSGTSIVKKFVVQ